jgi:soluble lytic murein transglycosylase
MILLVFLMAVLSFPSQAVASDGKALFKAGIEALNEGDYGRAIKKLRAAHEKLPVMGDYSLYYLSRAYQERGKFQESLVPLRKLLKQFPASPTRQKAMYMEIMDTLALGQEGKAARLLEGYVKEFPADGEMEFLYGYMLKKTGRNTEAREAFKEVYIAAGPLSDKAHEELEPEDISLKDILERASNLIRSVRHEEAEAALRAALKEDDGTLKKDLTEKLALCLFMQKRYAEAAGLYMEAEDPYDAARSLLRSGDDASFEKALGKLVSEGDGRAAELMLPYADGKRREGRVKEALELLTEAGSRLPSVSEEARWRTGWTHYRNKDYGKALEVFTGLADLYGTAKYLYWKAKAAEKTGLDASSTYKKISGGDYYAFLARLKNSDISTVSTVKKGAAKKTRPVERADLLVWAGLEEDAVGELLQASQNASDNDSLLSIARRLKELDRYRDAILLVNRLPAPEQPYDILYPLAYWHFVKEASAEYGIDPLLLVSVIREESRFDTGARSSAGAAGLMQLMPFTAERTADSLKLVLSGEEHLYDAETNIRLGAHHLAGLIKEFGSVSTALAAYNAGRTRVREWLKSGGYDSYDEFIEDIPFRETRNYVKRILTTYFQYRKAPYPPAPGGHETVF